MDTFGFTQKKFLSLSFENQHKHLMPWLSGYYQKLTTNRIEKISVDLFSTQYNQILSWAGMEPFVPPHSYEIKIWLERLSDAIHYHRCELGLSCKDHDLLEKVTTQDRSKSQEHLDCHMALDGLRSLFNVGSIFRTCEAAGFASIILGNTPGKEHPNVQKTAMGSHQWVEQEKTCDLAQTLSQKKEKGYQIIGVETIKGACAFDEFSWQPQSIVVLGNEEYGVSSHVMKTCDEFVYIPMFGKKNSINVANAAAIICFQIARALALSKHS